MAPTGITETTDSPPSRTALPRSYLYWLAGTRASLVGDAALHFALGWAASAHGGRTAALVLTAITLPRTVFLLLGGAVGDRFGARRMMITGDVTMLVTVLALAVAARLCGTPPWMLVGFAVVVGTVDAFYLPATGSMPRRLVSGEQLPRAMALQQAGGQVAALLGAPLGAVLVAGAGLSGAALVDAVGFTAVLAVMWWVRPTAGAERSPRTESLLAGIADGVRTAATDPVLRAALLLTAAAAAGLLPAIALLGPLLARSSGWGPGPAGLVAAGQGAGMLLTALVAARLGPMRRIGVGASLGPVLAAAGLAGLAAAPTPAAAVAAAGVVGAGSGMFACHIGPLVLAGAPDTHLSRIQSLLTLVQSLALVVANNVLGWFAHEAGVRSALASCAVLGCAAGATGLASPALRGLRRAPEKDRTGFRRKGPHH
ncbi:MFS transporter [Streptomyces sp. sk2.1]|uniref:MFS transporter n=1 Tax=Streptomyces sp. sk2.1 TaxID=2478959 RepID=UPI0011E775FB|nr:MFS transporter [Streptomyces sp. sk2.1]TXS67417.1 MFS transporter [Streptomyces sp. sk2.1]